MLGFKHIFSLGHPETGRPWIEYVMTPDGRDIERMQLSPDSDPFRARAALKQ